MSPDSVLHMLHRGAEAGGVATASDFTTSVTPSQRWPCKTEWTLKPCPGMLGHFSAGFTLDTYAHVTTSAKREAAKTMGSILSGAV